MALDREVTGSFPAHRTATRLFRLLPSSASLHSFAAWLGRYRVILFFLLGLVGVDGLVYSFRHVWRAYDPDDYVARVEGCHGQRWDLVLIGGSPVSEGIDPALLAGVRWQGESLSRVYNLGLPGGTTTDFWHAARHGITTPPRLIVYGITASDLNDSRAEPQGTRLVDLRDVYEWVRRCPSSAEWVLRHYVENQLSGCWGLYRYRNGIRLWAADHAEQWWLGVCPETAAAARSGLFYSNGLSQGSGYAPRFEFKIKRLNQQKVSGQTLPPFPFLDSYRLGQHLACLHQLLDWADQGSIPVVLVDMPISADLEHRFPTEFASYEATLAELERSRGVRILRARREVVGLDDSHFGDLIHLNAEGTTRFCAWLRGQLTVVSGEW